MPASPDKAAAVLEPVAGRQPAEEGARRALAIGRTRLVLGRDARSVFFAALALRLAPEPDWSCPTMATDGRRLAYNPEFVTDLSPDELVGVLAHEVLHCAMAHHCRRMGRDAERWNVACDLAVNPILLRAGFVLPASRLMPGEGAFGHLPADKSAEEYFALLPEPPQQEGLDGGGDGADPGGCGTVRDPGDGSTADTSAQEAEWRVAIAQAEAAARARGELPAGLARTVAALVHPPADWRAVLREFVSAHARNDYSWARPNRRFVAQGLYLPGLHSEALGEVVIAVDTSGSVGPRELALFGAEVNGVLSAFECTATVVYHDSEVHRVDEWQSGDGPLQFRPVGGGGTSHVCVFEWVHRTGRLPPCVVCLTDLETEFPPDPGVPVLWAVVRGLTRAPFGRVVSIGG